MSYQNYEQFGDAAKKIQQPFQALAELNIRTLQSFEYLRPEDLTHVKKPEELLEKHVNVLVQNGHKALDYMQQSFQILEQAMADFVHESKKAADAIKK